jgi:broad specificity phosphatase PhoE
MRLAQVTPSLYYFSNGDLMKVVPVSPGWRRVLLIRHGETVANESGVVQGCRLDAELNQRGQQQAQALSPVLGRLNVGLLTTSHLKRAKQTAMLALPDVAARIEILELSELREMDYGEKWDGVHVSKIGHDLKAISRRWASGETHVPCPEGGESPEEVLIRVKQGLRQVLDRLRTMPEHFVAVVVAHNFVNKIFLTHASGERIATMQQFEQNHACINVLDFDTTSNAIRVVQVNFSEHVSHL